METKNEVLILNKNPQLIEDITLFKIILLPSELFLLKFFFIELRPMNIREVYSTSIFYLFHHLFENKNTKIMKIVDLNSRVLTNSLIISGYGSSLIDEPIKKRVMEGYSKELTNNSETKQEKYMLKEMIKNNSKVPSYDKIKTTFSSLERMGIIYKRGKEGKGIIYALNPFFYSKFKDKRDEIINI